MKKKHIFYTFCLISISLYNATYSWPTFENIYSKLFSRQKQEIIQKELTLGKHGTLLLNNIYGNIYIKTEWSLNSVILKANKRISKKENPQNLNINIETDTSNNTICIETIYKQDKPYGSVDYELIVPHNIKVQLQTKKGDIKIKRVNGKIKASSENGTITVLNARGPIDANTQNGNITISQSIGNINAHTKYGNIAIVQSSKSIQASTQTGTITVNCNNIPSTGFLSLTNNAGSISLLLPKETNADIKAQTSKGRVTSEHFITLKSQSVLLNKKTWERFKREVDGTIGSGESIINLCSHTGNIKILKQNT